MLSLSVCLICSSQMQGLFRIGLDYAYPSVNLYLMQPGFENPALSHGPIGFVNNPAGLARLETNAAGAAFAALPSGTGVSGQMGIDPEDYNIGYITDSILFPYEFQTSEKPNIDYMAGAFTVGKNRDWVLGIAVSRGDFIGLSLQADLSGSVMDSISFSDTIDAGDIPDLPSDVVIPVDFLLTAQGQAEVRADGQASFASMPITVAIARKAHKNGWAYGFGLKITPVWTKASLNALLSGSVSADASLAARPGSDWTIAADFTGRFQSDSLARYYFDATASSISPSLLAGVSWQTSWLSLGFSMERGAATSISGQWSQFAVYPWDTVYWHIEDDDLVVDTANKTITGTGTVVITGFGQDTASGEGLIESLFSKTSGTRLGLGLSLGKIVMGLSGGSVFNDDFSYFRGNLGLSTFTTTNISVGFSIVGYWQYYIIADFPVSPPPVLAAGLRVSFPVKNATVYLGTRGSSTSLVGALVLALVPGEIVNESSASYASLGAGFTMPFGQSTGEEK